MTAMIPATPLRWLPVALRYFPAAPYTAAAQTRLAVFAASTLRNIRRIQCPQKQGQPDRRFLFFITVRFAGESMTEKPSSWC